MSALVSAALASTASLSQSSSRAHQREANVTALLSRGHVAHVGVRVDLKERAPVRTKSDVTSLLNWRGLERSASFSSVHSHRLPVLPRLSRKRACLVPSGQARAYSVRFSDCRPSALNTCRHQRLVNNRAERLHHQTLSSSLVSVGIDPNERRLTYAKRSFAPGAKAND